MPPGYRRCHSCKTQLATRRCTPERRHLCFVCYRREHLEGDGCWHAWEPLGIQTPCSLCAQHDATTIPPGGFESGDNWTTFSSTRKNSRELPLCEACWDRTHAQPNTLQYRGILVEESTVGYGTGEEDGGHPDHYYYGAESFGYV